MKKIFLLICFSIIFSQSAFSSQKVFVDISDNYIFMLNEPCLKFEISNPEIIKVLYINTIFNEKQQLMVKPLKLGSSSLKITTKNKDYDYEFIVNKNNTKQNNLLKFKKIDKPPLKKGE